MNNTDIPDKITTPDPPNIMSPTPHTIESLRELFALKFPKPPELLKQQIFVYARSNNIKWYWDRYHAGLWPPPKFYS